MIALLVALLSAAGAVLRYTADQLVESTHQRVFPFGTFTVNVTGSFALGLLTGLGSHAGVNREVVTVLGAGLLGGYTTFSTWAWESVVLLRDGAVLAAAANVLGSLVVGVAAAAAGLALVS